jgi:hypothetical protein
LLARFHYPTRFADQHLPRLTSSLFEARRQRAFCRLLCRRIERVEIDALLRATRPVDDTKGSNHSLAALGTRAINQIYGKSLFDQRCG